MNSVFSQVLRKRMPKNQFAEKIMSELSWVKQLMSRVCYQWMFSTNEELVCLSNSVFKKDI